MESSGVVKKRAKAKDFSGYNNGRAIWGDVPMTRLSVPSSALDKAVEGARGMGEISRPRLVYLALMWFSGLIEMAMGGKLYYPGVEVYAQQLIYIAKQIAADPEIRAQAKSLLFSPTFLATFARETVVQRKAVAQTEAGKRSRKRVTQKRGRISKVKRK
jgi:hypothetical protein